MQPKHNTAYMVRVYVLPFRRTLPLTMSYILKTLYSIEFSLINKKWKGLRFQ